MRIPDGFAGVRGLKGDACRNTRYHGGPSQAILLVTSEGLEEIHALGFPLYPGALGENLTTRGLDRRRLRIGTVVRAGDALLSLTKIRVPCRTLNRYGRGIQAAIYDSAVKAGDPSSEKWGLSGFYARVLQPGPILENDIIAVEDPVVSQLDVEFA